MGDIDLTNEDQLTTSSQLDDDDDDKIQINDSEQSVQQLLANALPVSAVEASVSDEAKRRQNDLIIENAKKKKQKISEKLDKLKSTKSHSKQKEYLQNELDFVEKEISRRSNEGEAKTTEISSREHSVSIGNITPFSSIKGLEQKVLSDASDNEFVDEIEKTSSDDDDGDNDNDSLEEAQLRRAEMEDSDFSCYYRRLATWAQKRQSLRAKLSSRVSQGRAPGPEMESEDIEDQFDPQKEPYKPHPQYKKLSFSGGLVIPGEIARRLYKYQRTGVQWLWELYTQGVGGIIGDEMGLGKTIQVIAFLAGLHHSKMLKGFSNPILIVCPATVMRQWANEFHAWWPPFRVFILHASSNFEVERSLDDEVDDSILPISKSHTLSKRYQSIFHSLGKTGHILITTYAGLRIHSETLLPIKWDYVVLDEGHKIRNPDSEIALTCKQLHTHNRIILTGTPIQNNLTEIWSLFDFVFPGRLGTLPIFQAQFSLPIQIGGYANASSLQIQTAYRCACILRDLIGPYMLRRLKSEVATSLPGKEELILFCNLTKEQRRCYKEFLKSDEMQSIFNGKRHVLYGIDMLRKICNHPDIIYRDVLLKSSDSCYGDPRKSGKLKVLQSLLIEWKKTKHRCLVFCQTRQMLDIIEKCVSNMSQKFSYLRMDGTTSIGTRQGLVDQFNDDDSIDIFLLTTRVGGLGINLTGADRVIIFDPDWNPSTDLQARERAWRLGQKKDVLILRLMTSGTIEEKIYHRQIYKQLLSSKILTDPNQSRMFKFSDLHDLFTLGEDQSQNQHDSRSLTGELFMGSEKVFQKGKKDNKSDNLSLENVDGVQSIEAFEDKDKESKPIKEEISFLESIFADAGVNSAVYHEKIVNNGQSESERQDIDKEAQKYARNAYRAINSNYSQMKQSQQDSDAPIWTAQHKKLSSNRGESSKSILERLKDRR